MHEIMYKTHWKYAVIATIFCFITAYILQPNLNQQAIILLVFAGLIGVPHGLTDWYSLMKLSYCDGKLQYRLFFYYIIFYCAIIILFILFWLATPIAALIIFLCAAAWHFGNQDVEIYQIRSNAHFNFFILGSLIIILPYLSHSNTSFYFNYLTNTNIFIYQSDMVYFAWCITPIYLILSWKMGGLYYFFETLILAICAIILPPLVIFTLYFCIWHTPRHYLQVLLNKTFLYNTHLIRIIYVSVILCLLIILGLFYKFPNITEELALSFIKLFFVGLAGLTIAHVLLSIKLQKFQAV